MSEKARALLFRGLRRTSITTALIALAVSACAPMIAPFDMTTFNGAATLSQLTMAHIDQMEQEAAPACFFDQHQGFYVDQRAKVAELDSRVRTFKKNENTVAQVEELRSALANFEALHKSATAAGRCQSPAELAPARNGLKTIFNSIRQLETEKRGAPATPA